MQTQLEKIETKLRELIEVHMVGIFPRQKLGQSALQQIAMAVRSNMAEMDGIKTAPNVFTLIVHPGDRATWNDAGLLDALKETLQAVARETELRFAAPPVFSVKSDASIAPGEVRVAASHTADSLGPTDAILQETPDAKEENSIPKNAFLILHGRKVIPLNSLVINIGRRLENQLAIDDPRVSRTHAQLRSIKGRFVIFDLNSTGGTFVNGQRTSQSILYPGDVISLAGVSLVYGQDNPPPRPDLKDTGPLKKETPDRTTAILKTHSGILKTRK